MIEQNTGSKTIVGLLGFGEVGQVLADNLSEIAGVTLHAFDLLFDDNGSAPSRALRTRDYVEPARSAAALARACDVIICAVTAAKDVVGTQSLAANLKAATYVVDVNSVSPDTKRECAAIVSNAGGKYVEATLMAPVNPKGSASPIILGGPHAARFISLGNALGFCNLSVFSSDVGPASAIKMCRSVIVKGVESVVMESMLTARHYGVEEPVLESLDGFMQVCSWPAFAHYLTGRSIEHGLRRAEEMHEVASTVAATGIEPTMSLACASRQEWAAGFFGALELKELQPMLDSIWKQLRS